MVKKAAAIVNTEYGMDPKIGEAIQQAADDVRVSVLSFGVVLTLGASGTFNRLFPASSLTTSPWLFSKPEAEHSLI